VQVVCHSHAKSHGKSRANFEEENLKREFRYGILEALNERNCKGMQVDKRQEIISLPCKSIKKKRRELISLEEGGRQV